jgi:hypothetical protein
MPAIAPIFDFSQNKGPLAFWFTLPTGVYSQLPETPGSYLNSLSSGRPPGVYCFHLGGQNGDPVEDHSEIRYLLFRGNGRKNRARRMHFTAHELLSGSGAAVLWLREQRPDDV